MRHRRRRRRLGEGVQLLGRPRRSRKKGRKATCKAKYGWRKGASGKCIRVKRRKR